MRLADGVKKERTGSCSRAYHLSSGERVLVEVRPSWSVCVTVGSEVTRQTVTCERFPR